MRVVLTFLILMFFFYPESFCQVKKTPPKHQAKNKKQKEPAEFDYDAFFKSGGNASRSREDSIKWIKDSIAYEIQNQADLKMLAELDDKYYYPKDSLSYIDNMVKNWIHKDSTIRLDSTIQLINSSFRTSLQKARAVFCWVASTIKYDWVSYRNNSVRAIISEDFDAAVTFRTKLGVCQNYANLFKYMCRKMNVECEVVTGWARLYPNALEMPKESNHAWNVVNTNKGWMLIESTWAYNDFSEKLDSYWFNTPPAEFIYNHLPEDSFFQFLKQPVSAKEFARWPVVSDFLFKSKIDFEVPEYGSYTVSNNKFSISMPAGEKNYSIFYTISPFKGYAWADNTTFTESESPETKKIINKKNKTVDYEIEFPSKGTWWLCIGINRHINNKFGSIITFPNALRLRITN